jgi:hypothetical protein
MNWYTFIVSCTLPLVLLIWPQNSKGDDKESDQPAKIRTDILESFAKKEWKGAMCCTVVSTHRCKGLYKAL